MTNTKEELKPCPFCGCKDVWNFAGLFHVYVECADCGATLNNSSACVLYHRDRIPEKLIGVETYEATALAMKQKDGTVLNYPDHGYVGVNVLLALKAYGVTDRWNARCNDRC